MYCVSGEILSEKGLEKGYICVENNIIVKVGKENPSGKPIVKGYITPSFFNAHTHLGDFFVTKKIKNLPRDLEKLVAPPDGLKHRLLSEASDEEIINGIKSSLDFMIKNSTSLFCDFREGGLKGIDLIKRALEDFQIKGILLSRPSSLTYDKNELDMLLKESNGVGLSSISDWDYEEIRKVARHTKKRNKIFALHASERYRENIDLILDLKPDFLVHMVHATKSDLERIKEENIPVVVCPRSNVFFNLKPNVKLIREVGVKTLLGTDNAMISMPDVLEEIRWLREHFRDFTIEELLSMVTYLPREIFKLQLPKLEEGSKADFVVLNTKYLKPIFVSSAKGS
ncbi:MAG: amidohydrolase family protein [Thermoplasmata archaeon]|nr:amidohydrolase family protein [Thermoplasmata archaeon]